MFLQVNSFSSATFFPYVVLKLSEMTVSIDKNNSSANNYEIRNDSTGEEYKQVLKRLKAHDRTIIGIEVFRNTQTGELTLATFAHDSLKLWSISAFEEEFTLFHLHTVDSWNCGIQSYTTSHNGKLISLLSTDSSLHHISLNYNQDPQIEIVRNSLMEMWFLQTCPKIPGNFLTVNFVSGQLEIINMAGTIIRQAAFERTRQISSVSYGEQFIAIGSSQGVIYVCNSTSLATLYSTEGHAMKVRCLVQTMVTSNTHLNGEDQQQAETVRLLSGSDDKTIKLFSLSNSKAQLLRLFCGHKGIVTGLAFCPESSGERFASSGADNTLIIWAMDSGEKLHVLANCTATLNDVPRSICFTPNGSYLLVGTEEATILAWRVPQPELIQALEMTNGKDSEYLEQADESEPNLMVMDVEEEEEENDENHYNEPIRASPNEYMSPSQHNANGLRMTMATHGQMSPLVGGNGLDEETPPHDEQERSDQQTLFGFNGGEQGQTDEELDEMD